MMLSAKSRLQADNKTQIENIRNQIEQLRSRLPSKTNTTKVNPEEKGRVNKQINDLKNRLIDLQTRKEEKNV